jgi:hypothetical protein
MKFCLKGNQFKLFIFFQSLTSIVLYERNCSEEGIQRITKLQKRAARIILDAPFFTPSLYFYKYNLFNFSNPN